VCFELTAGLRWEADVCRERDVHMSGLPVGASLTANQPAVAWRVAEVVEQKQFDVWFLNCSLGLGE